MLTIVERVESFPAILDDGQTCQPTLSALAQTTRKDRGEYKPIKSREVNSVLSGISPNSCIAPSEGHVVQIAFCDPNWPFGAVEESALGHFLSPSSSALHSDRRLRAKQLGIGNAKNLKIWLRKFENFHLVNHVDPIKRRRVVNIVDSR